jgi:hypothetical protein
MGTPIKAPEAHHNRLAGVKRDVCNAERVALERLL